MLWECGLAFRREKYREMCPDSTPPAFENTRSSHCSYLQENFTSTKTYVPKYYENIIEECNELGYEPAYNEICSKDNKLRTDALCNAKTSLVNVKCVIHQIKT